MTTQTEALKLALDEIKRVKEICLREAGIGLCNEVVIAKLEEALAQPEQNLKLMPREATPEMLKAMDECSTEGYDERLYEGHAGSVYMAAWDAFHGQHCYCGDITSLGVIHRDDGPCHYPDHKEPEQEPVAWITQGGKGWLRWHKSYDDNKDSVPLYTTPPQRKPLTFDEVEGCFPDGGGTNEYGEAVVSAQWLHDFAAAIQRAAHGIKE